MNIFLFEKQAFESGDGSLSDRTKVSSERGTACFTLIRVHFYFASELDF